MLVIKRLKSDNANETLVFIENEQASVDIDAGLLELLRKTAAACLEEEGVGTSCEINILLTDDNTIRQFN
ncbi:MAG: hypothetical protein ACM3XR_10765, partial [Bacillota bacterium]